MMGPLFFRSAFHSSTEKEKKYRKGEKEDYKRGEDAGKATRFSGVESVGLVPTPAISSTL